MAGLWESHYWLFTGRDWSQDRDNISCNTGLCSHDHVSSGNIERKATPEQRAKLQHDGKVVAIAALGFILAIIATMGFCGYMGWLD